MKCECGKEVGIRLFCKECQEREITNLKQITKELIESRERFERETKEIFDSLNKKLNKILKEHVDHENRKES